MVALAPGLVVLVRFPFSDLSFSKLRPAVVLAHAGGVDWVLCQVTSNPYGDPVAIALTGSSFVSGGLNRDSFARPGKLFTATIAANNIISYLRGEIFDARNFLNPSVHKSEQRA